MPGIDYVLPLKKLGDGRLLCFELQSQEARNVVWSYVERLGPKANFHFRVQVGQVVKPITRGYRSLMNRHWGHCSDIAQQLTDESKGIRYTKEMVDRALRTLAVREKDGLRTFYNEITDDVEPIHMSECSAKEANLIELVKQRFCGDRFWLTEYIDPLHPEKGSYKSVGGRTFTEMEAYWREQTGKGERPDSGDSGEALF